MGVTPCSRIAAQHGLCITTAARSRPPAPAPALPCPASAKQGCSFRACETPALKYTSSCAHRQSGLHLGRSGRQALSGGFEGDAKRSAAGDGATVPQEASDSAQRPTGRVGVRVLKPEWGETPQVARCAARKPGPDRGDAQACAPRLPPAPLLARHRQCPPRMPARFRVREIPSYERLHLEPIKIEASVRPCHALVRAIGVPAAAQLSAFHAGPYRTTCAQRRAGFGATWQGLNPRKSIAPPLLCFSK